MKKIKYFIITIISILIIPLGVNAASGTIKVTGSSQVVVGNKITFKVTLSSSTKIGSWEMVLDYDKNYLDFIKSTSDDGGTKMGSVMQSAAGVSKKEYEFTFRAKKTGSTTLKVGTYVVYTVGEEKMSITSTGKTIKIMTQEELEATYSKDNDLKSLSVEGFELNEEFSKDLTAYTVTVPEDTKQITINAKENDSSASVTGTGTFDVTQGTNTFEIVVRAENGSEKTYTLTIEVKDNNPINVSIDDENYTVVKIKEYLPQVNAYQETIVKINGFDIPAYKSDLTKMTLVGLKDTEGNIALYIYDEKNNTYTKYNEIVGNNLVVYPKETDKVLKDYELGKIKIGDLEIPAYYLSNDSRFAIIYGINVENGEEGFFKYDKETQSFLKYDDEMINKLLEQNELYSYIIIGFSGILLIMFILLIKKNKKKKKKENLKNDNNKKEEIKKYENKNEDKNEIIEIDNNKDEETYDILEKKSKKKKHKKQS